ncbi:MAG: GAF domain-containing protein, partial [Chloroflexi bacterium]|nr:GAF domain-containing protein [Chloroflexota bacterium]
NYQPHPSLAETRSQLVMPLRADQVVIGALDLHNKQPNGFSESDIILLHTVANQVAVAVDGLQLHETSQHSLHEKQALYQQTQNNLREIERLNYQLTGRMWSEYLRLQTESTNINLDLKTNLIVREVDWTSTLREAAQQRQLVSTIQAGHRVVAVPIMARNEVIGAMEFELESDQELPPAAVDLLRAVGQRIGMAIDNRRLLDETHRIAQREALINDISANLQSATSVNTVLQRAARHLQEALAAQEVTIRLGVSGSQESPVGGRDRP